MRADEIVVVIAAIAAIGWVNWYFFVAAGARADESGKRHSERSTRA